MSSATERAPALGTGSERRRREKGPVLFWCLLCALMPTAAIAARPDVPLPLQPFTVELLDLKRGEWVFTDALGQYLSLAGPVVGLAFPGEARGGLRLAYLCCDPEFPEDLSHAELRFAHPTAPGECRVDEPYFGARVSLQPARAGVVRCELRDIRLGPATTGDRCVAALYVVIGGKTYPVWLAPDDAGAGLSPRLLTDRVGNVFVGGEPVTVTLAASWTGGADTRRFAVRATDYLTGRVVWRGHVDVARGKGLARQTFELPLTRFGITDLVATAPGVPPARLRVCRIPRPRDIGPGRSGIGINIFQQQIWWYAYQVPLMSKAGVHWIRPWLAWENTWNMQESQPGRWDTRALDAALRRMRRYSQSYQLILFAAPSWLTGASGWQAPPPEKMDAWAAYVGKLVSAYRGRIEHWEVWNEPDGMWPEPTRSAGEHYLAMLKATYEAAKRADPGCTVLGLSSAGDEDWLRRVAALGATGYFDVATLHAYDQPRNFAATIERRRGILERGGLGSKPIWVNELGATAYDFSPAYSAKYDCSERSQAATLATLYPEALSLDSRMKAFWFCTYDPRDAAHEPQWTGDAGIGVLYLGFLPKLSYAALAGTAHQLDGRKCLGRVDVTRDLHQISFEGPVAVVWHDGPRDAGRVPATSVGCLPHESVTVRDMLTNEVARGRAADLELDLSQGPLYIEGSRQMAAVATCESAVRISPSTVSLAPGATASVQLAVPRGRRVTPTTSGALPVSATVDRGAVRVAASPGTERASGSVRVSVTFPAGTSGLAEPHEVVRRVAVTIGARNLIRDGGFEVGDTAEWTPERTSPHTWDAGAGHSAPGSLRLDGPFDRRLVHWNTAVAPGRELHLRCWVRTEDLGGCTASLGIAFFAADRWLNGWCLATTSGSGPAAAPPSPGVVGVIPAGTTGWTLVEATLPADAIPAETHHAAFFLDANGGSGRMWLDDVDLWQPER